ncbi:MAG: DIP1984 family protein, partial [Pyramidobacter sp.]|nr:DIP1984 family protein [Pyramidobacter sp.]
SSIKGLTEMKLAQALQERADLNARIRQLNGRLSNNALVQEGEKPAENPAQLLKELNACAARLEELMTRINLTNSRTVIGEDTLTSLIARKDALHLRISSYRQLIDAASRTAARAARTEIKILSAVNVPALQKEVDAMSKQLREVENTIQENNWSTELL